MLGHPTSTRSAVCPLDCGNNRMENQLARCFSGRLPIVSSDNKHFGEEPAMVGTKGAGLIFFGNCDSRNDSFLTTPYKAGIKASTAFDGCGINNYEASYSRRGKRPTS